MVAGPVGRRGGWVVLGHGGGAEAEEERRLGTLKMGAIDDVLIMGAEMELPMGKMGIWEREAAGIPDSDPIWVKEKYALVAGVVG